MQEKDSQKEEKGKKKNFDLNCVILKEGMIKSWLV